MSRRSDLAWIAALGVVWAVSLASGQMDPYYLSVLMYTGINIMLAASLNLVNGLTGQFSLGHAGFMAVGGYISAFITTHVFMTHPSFAGTLGASSGPGTLVFLASLFAGGIGAAAVGYIVGLPSLRLRGDYLAIVTLGFGEIIRVIVLNIDAVGGARGLAGIPQLSTFGWVYSGVIITVFVCYRLLGSPQGRSFLSVREDEVAAEAMGVNSTRAKVSAFVIAAFFAGIAGGLFAHQLGYLNPQTFDFNKSFEIVIMVVMGGMGSLSGSVLAAVLLTWLREGLRELKDSGLTQHDYRMVVYAALLIVLMLARPNGFFGTREITDVVPGWLRRLKMKKRLSPGRLA